MPLQRRLQRRGQYTLLPITGYRLNTVQLSHHGAPALIFVDTASNQATLRFEAAQIAIERGSSAVVVEWQPGTPFSATQLYPFVDLLGLQVQEATATRTGKLQISFGGDIMITALPQVYEGWHFAMPGFTLHGSDGDLI